MFSGSIMSISDFISAASFANFYDICFLHFLSACNKLRIFLHSFYVYSPQKFTVFILTLSLSAYPLPPDTSHAYNLQSASMNPVDYPCSRKSHNRIHRYAQ